VKLGLTMLSKSGETKQESKPKFYIPGVGFVENPEKPAFDALRAASGNMLGQQAAPPPQQPAPAPPELRVVHTPTRVPAQAAPSVAAAPPPPPVRAAPVAQAAPPPPSAADAAEEFIRRMDTDAAFREALAARAGLKQPPAPAPAPAPVTVVVEAEPPASVPAPLSVAAPASVREPVVELIELAPPVAPVEVVVPLAAAPPPPPPPTVVAEVAPPPVVVPAPQASAPVRNIEQEAEHIAGMMVGSQTFADDMLGEMQRLKEGGAPRQRPADAPPGMLNLDELAAYVLADPALGVEVMARWSAKMRAEAPQVERPKASSPSEPDLSPEMLRQLAKDHPDLVEAQLKGHMPDDMAKTMVEAMADDDVPMDAFAAAFPTEGLRELMNGKIKLQVPAVAAAPAS
jgi:hypothetical protein